ncbi:MAG: hypothetical protein GY701_17325, partial [Sulfitobacter sp.]|nr:hypothetical protein [Sulfitobacter sp.]
MPAFGDGQIRDSGMAGMGYLDDPSGRGRRRRGRDFDDVLVGDFVSGVCCRDRVGDVLSPYLVRGEQDIDSF